jgi:hypothetical protein
MNDLQLPLFPEVEMDNPRRVEVRFGTGAETFVCISDPLEGTITFESVTGTDVFDAEQFAILADLLLYRQGDA